MVTKYGHQCFKKKLDVCLGTIETGSICALVQDQESSLHHGEDSGAGTCRDALAAVLEEQRSTT